MSRVEARERIAGLYAAAPRAAGSALVVLTAHRPASTGGGVAGATRPGGPGGLPSALIVERSTNVAVFKPNLSRRRQARVHRPSVARALDLPSRWPQSARRQP